uniref:Ring finger protein 135 n=1 Tax=Callithrix jacchus TaxID=9483 RepID=A0A8I3WVX4_CALJA
MGDRERNKKRLLELLQAAGTGNSHCADCGAADPDWASYKLGVFICLNCCGVHRNFPDISKVKSVRLDFWDDSIVEFMTRNGNLHVKAKFEARVPAFYYIPQANDCLVLKEQWIRAKYERREFMADGETISLPGNREGFLWKRGRNNSQFLRRRFVLLAREGLLKYYTKEEVEVQKSITEVGQELTELGERLVDIVRSLQSQRPLSESGPDNELSILGKLVTSDAAAGKIKDILHDLEEIQEKLRENFSWKEAPEAPTQREHLEAQSSSSCPMSDQSPALRRASHFAQWAINPTFNLKSLSCSLEVSRDFHTVTVSPRPQPYRGSCERFSTSQVLCSQALSSGKHYWEVDTRNCSHWAVGVASWEMSRDQVLGRTTDSCCVEWKGTNQLSAWHMVKETVLGSDRPGVVGIWLNLEEGKLAFYSVDNQEKLLYECTISASSPLHPAFWLYGLHPGNYLIIKQVKV